MSCAQAHWVGSKPIRRVMQLKLHRPTMAIGYSLRMCARNVDSTNPGPSNLVFRSKPIAEAEMSNWLKIELSLRTVLGPNSRGQMVYGQMVLDKLARTKRYKQNGIDKTVSIKSSINPASTDNQYKFFINPASSI